MYNKNLTAEEIAEMADEGEDITHYLSTPEKGHAEKHRKLHNKNICKTVVDFSYDMVEDIDALASQLNINRQAIIIMVMKEFLIRNRISEQITNIQRLSSEASNA